MVLFCPPWAMPWTQNHQSKRFLLLLTRDPAPFGGFSKATFCEFSSTSSKVLAPLFYFPSLALRL